jgi:hypothetical protein
MDPITFWTAVGSLAACVAAAAAVFANRKAKRRAKYMRLEGQWIGDLGDQWTFLGEIAVKETMASGRVRWSLVECPPSLPWANRIGESGYEIVEGTLEHGILSLKGKKIAEGDAELLALADYTMPLPSQADHFEGQSRQQKRGKWQEGGKLQGTVTYLTKAPPNWGAE